MEFAHNADRIRKTSTDDEENISPDEKSIDGVDTDHEPSLNHQLSMESLIECLKNAAEIQSEPGSLGENDNVRTITIVLKFEVLSKYNNFSSYIYTCYISV